MNLIAAVVKAAKLAVLKRAIRIIERAGLAVVAVKRGEGCVYLVSAKGTYVRFDKVKP